MADEQNGRVSTREFYNALMKQNEHMEDMERRLMSKLSGLPKICNQVETNKKEIDKLRNSSRITDAVNFLGAIVAGIIGAKTGP